MLELSAKDGSSAHILSNIQDFMLEKIVHWLIFFAIVAGVFGMLVQVLRYGGVIHQSAWTGL